jgi:hypothetical protein
MNIYELQCDMGTPAFGATHADKAVEIARVLRKTADKVEQILCTVSLDVFDHNGVKIGTAGEREQAPDVPDIPLVVYDAMRAVRSTLTAWANSLAIHEGNTRDAQTRKRRKNEITNYTMLVMTLEDALKAAGQLVE